MKTTGMVRRVDSLGRIVIPKEIRKDLKIKENEQVEINVSNDQIVLNRYSELNEYDESINNLIDIIEDIFDKNIIITNLSSIALTSSKYKELVNKELSSFLNNILEERKDIEENKLSSLSLSNESNDINCSFIIKTIIKNGDTIGLLIYLSDSNLSEFDNKLCELMLSFLDKYLE